MSPEVIALLTLAVVFLIATVTSAHMGALALVAAFLVGGLVYGIEADEVLAGFPGSMFVILVGVTYLFALAKNNGTVDWLVHASVRVAGGRIAAVPVVMFLVPAAITAIGAAAPAACAIIIPIALRFARRYGINPLLMSMMVIQGTTAGGFSPIGIYGVIVNGVTGNAGLATAPGLLFLGTFGTTAMLGAIAYLTLGGRQLIGRRRDDTSAAAPVDDVPSTAVAPAGPALTPTGGVPDGVTGTVTRPRTVMGDIETDEVPELDAQRVLTLCGLVGLVIATLVFGLHVGLVALAIAVLLTIVFPQNAKGAVDRIAWPTVLLIGGIMTYIAMLEDQGTVEWLGHGIAGISTPLLAAFVLLLIGAVVSAFASTTALLGVVIPLATPFLLTGNISVIGAIVALCIASSVVDCSPLSTMGALAVANSPKEHADRVFRGLMIWGMSLVVVAPVVTWTVLVLPTAL
jgi:di/tricarboxylate transporter